MTTLNLMTSFFSLMNFKPIMFVTVLAASLTAELEAYFVPQHLHLYRAIQAEVIDLSVCSFNR